MWCGPPMNPSPARPLAGRGVLRRYPQAPPLQARELHAQLRQPRSLQADVVRGEPSPSTAAAAEAASDRALPPVRRPTTAPQTRRSEPSGAADPQLVALTRALLGAQSAADVDAALQAGAPDLSQFRRLLTYLDRQNAPDVALEACRSMLHLSPTRTADAALIWTKLMQMHSRRRGGAAAALRIYAELCAAGVRPDRVTFNVAISAAGNASVVASLWAPVGWPLETQLAKRAALHQLQYVAGRSVVLVAPLGVSPMGPIAV